MNIEKMRPLGFRAIVEVLINEEEQQTKSGIIILTTKIKPTTVFKCKIIKLSKQVLDKRFPEDAPYIPDVNEGDTVYIENRYISRINHKNYGICNIYDIIGKVVN